MTAIRIQVTAEDIAAAIAGQSDPVEVAIARIAGVGCNVDRDVPDGYMATIGTEGPGATLVINLPTDANERLECWWDRDDPTIDPFEFRLELDDWLVDLFRTAE